MDFESGEAFVSALDERLGTDLRTVAAYDRDGYEFLYLRDDIATLYDEDMFEDARQGMILEGIGTDHLESLFSVGELESALYRFESAYLVHVVGDEYHGLVVTFDPSADVTVGPFVELCEAGLDAVV